MLFTLDRVIILVGIYFIVFSINQYYVDQFQKHVLQMYSNFIYLFIFKYPCTQYFITLRSHRDRNEVAYTLGSFQISSTTFAPLRVSMGKSLTSTAGILG